MTLYFLSVSPKNIYWPYIYSRISNINMCLLISYKEYILIQIFVPGNGKRNLDFDVNNTELAGYDLTSRSFTLVLHNPPAKFHFKIFWHMLLVFLVLAGNITSSKVTILSYSLRNITSFPLFRPFLNYEIQTL